MKQNTFFPGHTFLSATKIPDASGFFGSFFCAYRVSCVVSGSLTYLQENKLDVECKGWPSELGTQKIDPPGKKSGRLESARNHLSCFFFGGFFEARKNTKQGLKSVYIIRM